MKKSIIMGLVFAMMVFPIISLGKRTQMESGRIQTGKMKRAKSVFKNKRLSPNPVGETIRESGVDHVPPPVGMRESYKSAIRISGGGGYKKEYPVNKAGVAVQGFPSVKGAGDFLYEANGNPMGMGGSSSSPKCVFNKETKSVECTSESCSSSTTSYRRINPKTGKPMLIPIAPKPAHVVYPLWGGGGTTGSSGSTR